MVVVVDVFVKIFASDVTFDFDRWWSLRFSLALVTVQLCNEKNFWPWCVRYFFGWSCLEWIIHLRGPIFDYDYEDVVLSLPLCSRQLLHRPNSFFSGEDKTNKAVQDFFDGGNSAVVLNIVNCRALFVLPQIWMSQKTLCLQHFFLKGWDEAREIHAYPPGENNSTSFWIIFMITVLMRILFTIITIHIMVKTFYLSVGEERSLQKVRILRICRLCRPKSCEVDFSFIHLLCIWNPCWNIAQTFK